MAKSEFTSVLRRAEAGELQPVFEVKELDRGKDEFLYELRWAFESVEHVDDAGTRYFKPVHLRLYHAEPAAITNALIGFHLHEKVIGPDRQITRDLQNTQIDIAARAYWDGYHSSWGIL